MLRSDPPVEADQDRDALIVGVDTLVPPGEARGPDYEALPAGFFWRELSDLDVSSLDKLAEFANRRGVPVIPRGTFMFDGPLRADPVDRSKATFALVGEEARDTIRLLRNMVRVWQLIKGAISEEEYFESWEPCDPHGEVHVGRLDVPPKARVPLVGLSYLTPLLNHGIKEFSPYISIDAGLPTATLFGATCAQLFNSMVEERVWHRCLKCGRPFVRKWDTDSAKYCGRHCGDAVAHKKLRDKKKRAEQQRAAEQGLG